jgi:hypothetical protein
MSAIRYSGKLRIRVTYVSDWTKGPAGEYRCHISPIVQRNGNGDEYQPVTIYVGRAACDGLAVDSPKAFDGAARAALSFAESEGWPVTEYATYDLALTRWHVGRTRDKAWPNSQ